MVGTTLPAASQPAAPPDSIQLFRVVSPQRRLFRLTLIALPVLLLVLILAAGAVLLFSRIMPLTRGHLLYVAEQDGSLDVFLSDLDHAQTVNLTHHPAEDSYPVWSPDGQWIAFQSDRGGSKQLFVMDTAGAHLRQVVDVVPDRLPEITWAPNGWRFAFVTAYDGDRELYVMHADRSQPQRITNNDTDDWSPAWSPDGQWIAFISEREGNREIYLLDAACLERPGGCQETDAHNISDSHASDTQPVWSPDGQRLAFVSFRDGVSNIYIINVDGTGLRNLSDNYSQDWHPRWSPDGRMMAFLSQRHWNDEIYLIEIASGEVQRLTNSFSSDRAPAWSPDGQWIAFESDREGHMAVYITDLSGTQLQRITAADAQAARPLWWP